MPGRRWGHAGLQFALGLFIVLQVLPDTIVVGGEGKRDQWVAAGEVSVLGTPRALNYAPDAGRYSLQAAIAEEAPGALVVVGTGDLDDHSAAVLRAVGARMVDPPSRVPPPGGLPPPARSGVFLDGSSWTPWSLHRQLAEVEELILIREGPSILALDAALLQGGLSGLDPSRADVSRPGSLGRSFSPIVAGSVEGALLVLLMLLGSVLIPRGLVGPLVRPAASLLAGLAVLAALGPFLQGWAIALLPIGAIALGIRRARRWNWSGRDTAGYAVAGAVILAAAVLTRVLGLVFVSTDSMFYLLEAAAQVEATTGLRIPVGRSPGYAAVLAAGALVGVDGVFSLGLIALVAAVAVAVGAARRVGGTGPRHVGLVVLVLLSLGASAQFRTLTVLVNSHLLVAALVLLLGALWLVGGPSESSSSAPRPHRAVLAITAAALVLSRPEGVAVLALFLAGTIGGPGVDARWRWAWYGGGVAALLGFGPAASAALGQDPSAVWGVAFRPALGILLLAAPTLVAMIARRVRDAVPVAAVLLPWGLLLVLALAGHEEVNGLLSNTRVNLFEGAGGWGVSAVTMIVVLVLALFLASTRDPVAGGRQTDPTPLAVVIAAFVPVSMLVRAVGSASPGRIHWHDSTNRMWIHVLLAAVLLIASSPLGAARSSGSPTQRRASLVVPALIALVPAAAWSPVFAREVVPEPLVVVDRSVAAASADVGTAAQLPPGRPILGGLLIEEDLEVPESAPAEVEICVDVGVGTQLGTAVGVIEVLLPDVRDFAVEEPVAGLDDVDRVQFCDALGEPLPTVKEVLSQLGDPVRVRIQRSDDEQGPVPLVLVDEGGAPAASVTVRWVDRREWEEPFVRHGPRVAAILVGLALVTVLLGGSGHRRSFAGAERGG